METVTIEKSDAQLRLELAQSLPDNGTREAALLELKREWDKSCSSNGSSLIGIIFCVAVGIGVGYVYGVHTAYDALKTKYYYTIASENNYTYIDAVKDIKNLSWLD